MGLVWLNAASSSSIKNMSTSACKLNEEKVIFRKINEEKVIFRKIITVRDGAFCENNFFFFAKSSILDAWKGSHYASDTMVRNMPHYPRLLRLSYHKQNGSYRTHYHKMFLNLSVKSYQNWNWNATVFRILLSS